LGKKADFVSGGIFTKTTGSICSVDGVESLGRVLGPGREMSTLRKYRPRTLVKEINAQKSYVGTSLVLEIYQMAYRREKESADAPRRPQNGD
jgi:hypothetical protein